MQRLSGILFHDRKFLQEFERQVRRLLPPDEASEILRSYMVHESDDGIVLEFSDLAAIERFLAIARQVGVAGKSLRIVKLISCLATQAYRSPERDEDHWAKKRIARFAREGRRSESLIFRAEDYQRLKEDLALASLDIGRYLR